MSTTEAPPTPPSPVASPAPPPPPVLARRPVNVRSVTIGILGVLFIAGVTPYNNYVLNNTDLVGNFLPVGLILLVLALVTLVNAPLLRFAPRRALGAGELAVIVGMTLVSSALPAGGLMRYLPGNLTGITLHAHEDLDCRALLTDLNLPDWMFPRTDTRDWGRRASEPVIEGFTNSIRLPEDQNTFARRLAVVPWRRWAVPAVTWGAFFACFFGAVICLMLIFRVQWQDNERLPFPLAEVFTSLIESPPPGACLPPMFGSPGFWTAAVGVFLLHGTNGAHAYFPRDVPEMPLKFDVSGILADPPIKSVEDAVKKQTIYFTMIGVTYFVQTRVAFSLWFTIIAVQAVRVFYGATHAEMTGGMEQDQFMGALVVYGGAILWVGRRHLLAVGRQMFRPRRPTEPAGRYAPYRLVGWVMVACLAGMTAWLVAAGASLAGAAVIVGLIMLLFTVLGRVVAETGLPYAQLSLPLTRPWVYAAQDLPRALTTRTTQRSYFFASLFSGMVTHDVRQALPVYVSHAFAVADRTAFPRDRRPGAGGRTLAALAGALALAFVVSGAATLYVEYSYSITLDKAHGTLNVWGAQLMPRWVVLESSLNYVPPRAGPVESHSRPANLAVGAGVTALLSVLQLRYAAFPLHPVGYLLAYNWGIRMTWFSILLGWLAKVLILRFGGATLYRQAKSFFIGLIIGETAAVAFWLILSFALGMAGYSYETIQLLPT